MSSAGSHAEATFEDLFEHAPCGYAVVSADRTIERVNATLATWLGGSAGALRGKPFDQLLTVPGRIFYETNVAPILRLQGGVEEVMLDLRTLDGRALPVQLNATAVTDGAGGLAQVRFAVFRTDRRRRYERDLKSREATAVRSLADERSTAELREQFIAVLGHDLRNPLAAMLGAARLLRRELASDKALNVLNLMEASAERMAGLIDDVLDFARGRLGGGIVLRRRPTDLEPVLRQVIAEMESAHPGRVLRCDLDLPQPVDVDGDRLAQLVSNLLGNALTHGDPTRPVWVRASVEEHRLTVSVANAGAPIPPAAMERLFQPFFRGEVRPSQQGLGLGLHIASEIAKAHAGSLAATSDAGETRFTLVVPLA